LRIISWNCNGAFRKKFIHLLQFDADLIIIQECEDPAQSKDEEYKAWANNYLWVGENKNSGLGVFAKSASTLNKLDWPSETFQLFLPFTIDKSLTFIAVWTKQANSPTFQYIGQFWKYLQLNREKITSCKPFIIGDFNSNKIWDKWDRWWNHTDVVNELNTIGLSSIYHKHYNLEQGAELHHTFYLQRNISKHYHIDYAFLPNALIEKSSITICNVADWLDKSDHMPILIYVDCLPIRG
jgi:exonuclease III